MATAACFATSTAQTAARSTPPRARASACIRVRPSDGQTQGKDYCHLNPSIAADPITGNVMLATSSRVSYRSGSKWHDYYIYPNHGERAAAAIDSAGNAHAIAMVQDDVDTELGRSFTADANDMLALGLFPTSQHAYTGLLATTDHTATAITVAPNGAVYIGGVIDTGAGTDIFWMER